MASDTFSEKSIEELEKAASDVPLDQHRWCQWKPTSQNHLADAETKMLEFVKTPLEKRYVHLPNGEKLWTVIANNKISDKTPLVMVHGFGGGVGFWTLNFDAMSKNRTLYTFDLLGFGRSSRPKFHGSCEEVEQMFVQSIEEWRKAMSLEKFILIGHSFGGYLVSSYTLKYPDAVKKLILVDPWGFPVRDPSAEAARKIPLWIRVAIRLLSPFNPLSFMRAAGPLGPNLVKKFRSDFKVRFAAICEKDKNTVFEYIYHCNAGNPSGESAFKKMTEFIGYASRPMLTRIGTIREGLPITFIYGANSWMDNSCGYEAQEFLTNNEVDIYSISDAGHHVYADQPEVFHNIIESVCDGF